MTSNLSKEYFGTLENGKSVNIFTLENENGMITRISEFGATICSMKVPDRDGNLGEVVLGFDTLEEYLKPHPYIGSQIGRVANRLSKAQIIIDKNIFQLSNNEGKNQLYGGHKGFQSVHWDGKIKDLGSGPYLEMKYLSIDGEEGYPGNLDCTLEFRLKASNQLDIIFNCMSDKNTAVNLTRHEYWNLRDGGQSKATDHLLKINANSFTPFSDDKCLTGEIINLDNSNLDFREQLAISNYSQAQQQIEYDHNFIIDKGNSEYGFVACLKEESTGRKLEVYSSQPCLQFYNGGSLDGSFTRNGVKFMKHYGVCLEPQAFPDSFSNAHFPKIVLKKGDRYHQRTSYSFSTFS